MKKINKNTIAALLLTLFFPFYAKPQTGTAEKTLRQKKEAEITETAHTNEEKEQSDFEEKRSTILYGLGDDIIELITNLKAEEDKRFDADLQKIFGETKIPAVKDAVFSYFTAQKNNVLKAEALTIIENRHDYPKNTVNLALFYAGEVKINEAAELLQAVIQDEIKDFGEAAAAAMGKIGRVEDALFLADFFEGEVSDDEKQAVILKQAIMYALEELHYPENKDFFKRIAEDIDENAIIRGTAASALGKTGDEQAVSVLAALFTDKDPYIRASVIKGLSAFTGKEAEDILTQGFKDSYYKVRLQAITAAKERKRQDAVRFLLYRAKKDPELTVKKAAVEALSELNNAEANEWMLSAFKNEKTGQTMRLIIAEFLLKNNFELIYPEAEKQALESAANPQKRQFCIEIGKVIAKIDNEKTASVAEMYLSHRETPIKSLGLDMFKKNKSRALFPAVSAIAKDKKSGARGKRARTLLEAAGYEAEN